MRTARILADRPDHWCTLELFHERWKDLTGGYIYLAPLGATTLREFLVRLQLMRIIVLDEEDGNNILLRIHPRAAERVPELQFNPQWQRYHEARLWRGRGTVFPLRAQPPNVVSSANPGNPAAWYRPWTLP